MKVAPIAEQGLALCRMDHVTTQPSIQISLPFVKLTIRSDHSDYIKLCKQVLIDNSGYSRYEDTISANIFVTNKQKRSAIALPDFDSAKFGLGALITALEASKLDGCYDTDNDNWQFFDPLSGRGIQLQASASSIPAWESAFPLRNFLHWIYARQNKRLLHAGTLGINKSGVLLAGAGGAGKSGTTLAGIINGLQTVGDDYVALSIVDNVATAYPVIRLIKQDKSGLSRLHINPNDPLFGQLNWQNKYQFDFAHLVPTASTDHINIRAILLPSITGLSHSKITPANAHSAMLALLPNNLQQLPGQMKQAMSFLGNLTRRLPVYNLDLSTDPCEISDTIHNFIERGCR
ncbi:serine kinase [Brucellaceae bacterium C25G]